MTSQSPSYQSGTLPTQETTVAESNGATTKTGNGNHRCDKILDYWVKLKNITNFYVSLREEPYSIFKTTSNYFFTLKVKLYL